MSVKVVLFGRLTDIAGGSIIVNDVSDTNSLVQMLHKKYPTFANTKYLIAVDKEVIKGNTILKNNSMVALLPPFSGG